MARPSGRSHRGTTGASTPLNSLNDAKVEPTCALCRKTIKAGEKFLSLAIDRSGPRGSSRPTDARPSIVHGRRRSLGTASATCHLRCLHCAECGSPLSGPPRGAPDDDRGVLFDKGGAAAAYEEARNAKAGRASGTRAFTTGTSLPGANQEQWLANIFKGFVAHAKCAERTCAACGEVINPGEQQVSLPRSLTLDKGKRSASDGSSCRMAPDRPGSQSSKTDSRKMVSQHMRCTPCSTCGLSLETKISQETSGSGVTPPAQRRESASILLDDSGRPHHPSCMACCCCRQPLLGRYEVHSFFGYLRVCQQALSDDPPLLPLPEGRAAALFGTAHTQKKSPTQKGSISSSAARSESSTCTTHLQDVVTPLYGGLCCAWCQGRVPCCVSCERRCTVYRDANGQQFLPRAIASKAQRAAELAAAISLGRVIHPPQSTVIHRTQGQRKSATGSSHSQSEGLTSDALTRFCSTKSFKDDFLGGLRSTHKDPGRGSSVAKNTLSNTVSSHTLKTAETHGVLCGQCASLSLVETEDHLRSCVEAILQFLREEGIIFSAEMMHLQHLMNQVSEETEKLKNKRHIGLRAGAVRRTESSASAGSSGTRHPGPRIKSGHSHGFGVGSRLVVSKEVKPLQQVEAAGLRVDLVGFDALNDGPPKYNAGTYFSVSTPSVGWLSAGGGAYVHRSVSVSPHNEFLSCGRGRRCAPVSAFPYLSGVKRQERKRASRNVGETRANGRLGELFENEVNQVVRTISSQSVAMVHLMCPQTQKYVLKLSNGERGRSQILSKVFHSAAGGWKGHEQLRLLFGRCHVVEVSLVVAADAALQFDKRVRALQKQNPRPQTAGVRARGIEDTRSAAWGPATHRACSDVALNRLETAVTQNTLATAAACAASVQEEEKQLSRLSSASTEERSEEQRETSVAVTAGALLLQGSFAGGLVKTASGLHAQGLCVRLVKRLVVVGALPRILVLEHLAHEFIHAFLACKQKVITDLSAEEGACNVAAAAILLRTGAGLKQLLGSSGDKPCKNTLQHKPGDKVSFGPCVGRAAPHSESLDRSFELLLVRYRLWKMVESTDEIYGVGYRRCLHTVGANQLTFGAFVSQLLKGCRK